MQRGRVAASAAHTLGHRPPATTMCWLSATACSQWAHAAKATLQLQLGVALPDIRKYAAAKVPHPASMPELRHAQSCGLREGGRLPGSVTQRKDTIELLYLSK